MGSRGRSSPEYRAARELFRTGRYLCHLCGIRPGTWTDHVPPLSDFAHPDLWRGELKPSCPECQRKQGAAIRNRTQPDWTW